MNDWKKYLMFVAGGLGLLLVGYGWGRYATPAKVVTKTEVQVVQTEHVVEKVVTEIKVVKVDNTQKSSHHAVYDVSHPDGTKEHHETTDENVSQVIQTQADKLIDVVHEKETIKYVDKEVVKTVEAKKPDWRLGALAGFSIPETFGSQKEGYRLLPSLGAVQLGVDLDRRILGPISVGVWGLSSGSVGVKVGLEW